MIQSYLITCQAEAQVYKTIFPTSNQVTYLFSLMFWVERGIYMKQ